MVARACSLFVAALVGLGCGADATAQRVDDSIIPVVAVEPAPTTAAAEPDEPDRLSCVVPCLQLGRCANVEDRCVALDDGHCARARVCQEDGMCSAVDGACVKPPLSKIPECEAFIAAVLGCNPSEQVGTEIQRALEQALTAMAGQSATVEEARATMAKNCEVLLAGLSQTPCR